MKLIEIGSSKGTENGSSGGDYPQSEGPNKNKFTKVRDYLLTRYEFRIDTIANDIEYRKKGTIPFETLNEFDLVCELMEDNYSNIDKFVTAILRSTKYVEYYNPIHKYFNNLPKWDKSQPDYINQLAQFVDAKDQKWFDKQFKKMIVRMVACGLNVIPFNKQCFTLIGKQHDGKSSFIRFLCPPQIAQYYTENIDFDTKDGKLAMCQNFIINLDELANFTRYDIKQIKSFISTENIKARLPYDKRPRVFPRIANFLGSTNSDEFLTDETGNVRWLIHEINGVNHDNGGKKGYNQNVDINLVYAQAFALLRAGFGYQMNREDLRQSEENNRKYQITTMEQELLQKYFYPGTKKEHDKFLTTGNILEFIERDTKARLSKKGLGRVLKILNFEQGTQYQKVSKFSIKGYYVKVFSDEVLLRL